MGHYRRYQANFSRLGEALKNQMTWLLIRSCVRLVIYTDSDIASVLVIYSDITNSLPHNFFIVLVAVSFKSREDHRKQLELEEARKAGLVPAELDEDGKEINPHIPQYMSSAPWYLNAQRPVSLFSYIFF